MAKIEVDQLLEDMLTAAKSSLKKRWPKAKDYVESEFKKIGESILFIESQRTL